MRKEVYARKAKQAFSKLKTIYRDGTDLPKSNINLQTDEPTSFEKHSYQPFYQSKLYRIIKYSVLSVIAISVVWALFIQDHYDSYKQSQFEESGFSLLYKEELNFFNHLFEYVESNNDRIISMEYSSWSKDFEISLKHPDTENSYNNSNVKRASFNGGYSNDRHKNDDSIVNQSLNISRNKVPTTYSKNWVYRLNNVKNEQIPKSVKEYISLTNGILNKLIKSSKYGTDFYTDYEGVTTSFTHPDFGYYRLIYSSQRPQSYKYEKYGDTYEVVVGELTEGVYWSKEVKLEKNKANN